MKWNEIPKFEEFYLKDRITYGFYDYVTKYIKTEINEYNLEMNPDFQRGHVWTEEQEIAYIEFILRGGKTGRDFYFNYNPITNKNVCVDGLQRTTAFERFIKGKIMVFNQYFCDFNFNKRAITSPPLPEFEVYVYQNNLKSEKEVLQWYIDMNVGGTPHSKEEIDIVKKMIELL